MPKPQPYERLTWIAVPGGETRSEWPSAQGLIRLVLELRADREPAAAPAERVIAF